MAGPKFPDMTSYNRKLFFTIVIAALGYFVDVYELLLFTVVRVPSLTSLGISPEDKKAMLAASTSVINWQMTGLLIGGIVWGVMGDKRGRLSVLMGSILLYSLASFAVGYVETVQQYAWARFIGGIGLAGELGVEHQRGDHDGAGTAVTGIAADLGTGQAKFISQRVC